MPRGVKFKPTKEQLNLAFTMKMRGCDNKDIAKAIGISEDTYLLNVTVFQIFFAQQRRKMEVGVKRGPVSSLPKYRLAAVKLAELGEGINAIARQIGVPESTLKAWMGMDETFDHEMRSAKDNADELVIRALLKRATGFTHRTVTQSTATLGGGVTARTTTKTVNHVHANVKAIELWLSNRRKWLSENKSDDNTTKDNREVEYEIVDKLFNAAEEEDEIKETKL